MSNIGHNSKGAITDEVKQKVMDMAEKIKDSYIRIEAERDLVRNLLEETADETQLEKKFLRRLARTYFNNSFDTDKANIREFEELYEMIVKDE